MNKEPPKTKHRPVRGGYSAPTLSIYGDVAKLTAAGSAGSSEGSMTTDFTRKL